MSWNVLITGPPSWGFDVPLATALSKNLPAENTQRELSRVKPTSGANLGLDRLGSCLGR